MALVISAATTNLQLYNKGLMQSSAQVAYTIYLQKLASEKAIETRKNRSSPKKTKGAKKHSPTKTAEVPAPTPKPLGPFQTNRMDLEVEASDANKALQQLDSGMQQTVSKFAKNLLEQSRKATLKKGKHQKKLSLEVTRMKRLFNSRIPPTLFRKAAWRQKL